MYHDRFPQWRTQARTAFVDNSLTLSSVVIFFSFVLTAFFKILVAVLSHVAEWHLVKLFSSPCVVTDPFVFVCHESFFGEWESCHSQVHPSHLAHYDTPCISGLSTLSVPFIILCSENANLFL